MTKRDTKFVMRIIVLWVLALSMSLAVRIVLESNEITKILPRTSLRDFLIFLAPLASLLALQYTFAIKSFGIRSLLTEGLVFASASCIFLAITMAYYFGETITVAADCAWWQVLGCNSTQQRHENYPLGVMVMVIGIVQALLALKRERIIGRQR